MTERKIKKDRSLNIIYFILKYLFVIVILPKYIQEAVFIFVLFYLISKNHFVLKINKSVLPFFIVFIIHVFSITVNCISDFTIQRVIAALNTASLWFLGSAIYSYIVESKTEVDVDRINKYMFHNLIILVAMSILMLVLNLLNVRNIVVFSRALIGSDWIDGVQSTRLMAFMEYSNLISLFYFLCFPFACAHVKQCNKLWMKIILFLSILPVLLNKSRIGIILSILNIIICLPTIFSNSKKSKYFIVSIGGLLVLFFVFMNSSEIMAKVVHLLNSREGSTNMRTIIYQKSVEKALQSPIIGCGIKEFIGDFPLGSHSTIIGLFYKTGIIGLLFGIIGFISLIKGIIKKHNKIFLFSFACLFIMFFIEDLDGANWFAVTFFIMMGIFKRGKYEENINNYTGV